MTLLAIDPGRSYKGDATIGYSIFALEMEMERGRMSWEELHERVTFWPTTPGQFEFRDSEGKTRMIHEVVIEDFVNNEKSRGGQRNGTSETIGSLETICYYAEVPITRQEPGALVPAKLHAPRGSWKPLKHLRHEDSAYLHGYEYLVRQGRLQSAGLEATL